MLLNQNHTVSPKIETEFLGSSEIQTFFQPKNRWSPKKKKVFTKIETDFSAKVGNSIVFSGRITTCTSQLRHPISFGGAVFNFSPKIGLKNTENVRFCILHKPIGGLEPPHSPLATLLCFSQPEFWAFILKILVFGIYLLSKVELNQTEIYFVNCYR